MLAARSTPLLHGLARWCRAALVLWLLALATQAAQAQVLYFKQALTTEADSEFFPAQAAARTVSLPDDWAQSRPGFSGTVWYRLAFDASNARASGELLALYIGRACSAVDVVLNGRLVHSGGRLEEPVSRNCQRPQLVSLPAALIEPRNNIIDIKLAGFALERVSSRQRAGGLSIVELGPHALLAERHGWRTAASITMPQVVCGTMLLMGGFMFAMGWFYRLQTYLSYYGALLVGWGVLTMRIWVPNWPWPNATTEFLSVVLMSLVALASVQFLMRYAGRRFREADWGMPLQCAVLPLSLMVAGPDHMHAMATGWYALMAVEVGAAMVYYLRVTRAEQPQRFWAMAPLLGVLAVGIAVWFVAQLLTIPPAVTVLAHILMPLVFMALGLRLVQQYGNTLQAAELGRAEMEHRIREATAQIERNFAQMADAKVEQVTERERKRIAADLHDDLGAKLLTIVHTSEDERISTLAREALEEMRLSVRGLTGKPVRLLDALGDWRAETMSRLSQAGLAGEWQAPTEEEVPRVLTARAYVQTTRILRESVSNIIKHSGASNCSIRCTISNGDFQLVVQDNGNGIPMELDGQLDRGHGMASMKHRAKQMQGQCLVESGPGYGTVIRLTVPLDEHTAPA